MSRRERRERKTTWLPTTYEISMAGPLAALAVPDAALAMAVRAIRTEHLWVDDEGHQIKDPDWEPARPDHAPLIGHLTAMAATMHRLLDGYRDAERRVLREMNAIASGVAEPAQPQVKDDGDILWRAAHCPPRRIPRAATWTRSAPHSRGSLAPATIRAFNG
jgi:hypothetical protein